MVYDGITTGFVDTVSSKCSFGQAVLKPRLLILVLAQNADIVQPLVPDVHFSSENNKAA